MFSPVLVGRLGETTIPLIVHRNVAVTTLLLTVIFLLITWWQSHWLFLLSWQKLSQTLMSCRYSFFSSILFTFSSWKFMVHNLNCLFKLNYHHTWGSKLDVCATLNIKFTWPFFLILDFSSLRKRWFTHFFAVKVQNSDPLFNF